MEIGDGGETALCQSIFNSHIINCSLDGLTSFNETNEAAYFQSFTEIGSDVWSSFVGLCVHEYRAQSVIRRWPKEQMFVYVVSTISLALHYEGFKPLFATDNQFAI